LEIRAAPLALHRTKELFEVLLDRGMRAVEDVPWTTTPAAERDAIRSQRRAVGVFHKPVWMLLEDMRLLLSDERCDPDRRLEAARADLFQHALHVAAKRRAGFEPVAHSGLVAVVDLHVTQTRR